LIGVFSSESFCVFEKFGSTCKLFDIVCNRASVQSESFHGLKMNQDNCKFSHILYIYMVSLLGAFLSILERLCDK
jgi:hypothetical protein